MTTETREDRLERRITHLYDTDSQFAGARPSDAVNAAVDQPDLRLPAIVKGVLAGYADRPALGQRAVELVTDANGRTTAELQPRFETITYRQLSDRVQAVTNAWHNHPVKPGDRVAILGFTSVDYTTIDTALIELGAVSVPLQTSAPVTTLRPIVAETEPTVIAASIDFLDDAVELVRSGPAPHRLVVFDYRPQVDAQREAFEAAKSALAGTDVVVESLADVLDRGRSLADAPLYISGHADPLTMLIYTSGSTGTPKGAMYPESKVANMWQIATKATWDENQAALPAITLNFMPMSHVMGRGILIGTLSSGGTAYFAARSDLSTFLDDLALIRPTQLSFVPRIWDMLFQEYQSRVDRAGAGSEDQVLAEVRESLLGGRFVSAMTGSAPISAEMRSWVERLLDMHLLEGYGSTEAGSVFVDGQIQRPPVIDYKLVDVPDLGYFRTDQPHPRGELLVKSEQMFPGYYKRPEITAEMFDEDGYYRTGDIVAELGPDHVQYLDRRNNVLKLSQGEFVTVSKLEAVFGDSPLVRQIFIYGNSARSYLLAVVVPTDLAASKQAINDSLQEAARAAGLQSYEVPRDFIVETTPFSLENGLLTGIRKLARPNLKAYYGDRLEQLYADLAEGQASELSELRRSGADAPVLDTVSRAAGALLGAAATDLAPDAHFTDLGGDSLSALTFSNLLHEIFDVDVPVGVIVSPATDLAGIAGYIEGERHGSKRPTYASVHGRNATEVHARDLTLDKFLDADALAAAPGLPKASTEVRTVLLTGATGFLGRYLALEWLERMDLVDGKLICLVRAKSDAEARARLDATFDTGDAKLLVHYRELAAEHLEVIVGDKGEADLGLDHDTWQRLADDVDLIVDPAALVNHVLPYSQMFDANALGTAELIRIALTTKIKPFVYVSTIGVAGGIKPGEFVEDADIRVISPTRQVDDSYANGYGNSKWAGEVLLREAHDLCGLPVSVFRCDMILADTTYSGQLNLPDMFTRLMLSLVATGIAPGSFYVRDADGNRQRAHYDGLPVEFISEAISTLGVHVTEGFETYHVMNPYDDGIGLDEFVDWLIEAGYPVHRIDDYATWLQRFDTALRALPDKQRQASLLPLLHNYQQPSYPLLGAVAPTDRFRAAVQEAKIGPDKDIPHISAPIIVKYITNLQQLGLL
ncbi:MULTISPECIES: carboxylic acid reductase [unclassified Mycolicibacterium]|uniref:carboxylic acid reductase n=2 Tax=Mycolicibacterium TaxID=1866885 RepID=UPI0012DBDCE2|nr:MULTISPECIES: carboxylic acid reductase [unclassified Mycolicibacterium]MUL84343.1 carboxylic acid reductase [Mycolicibacterium sp. CBMA 329]MUL88118.1 carboxylic acid reductase [Mycolicibacterium sp. CBMA 331]MUM02493.1 carboxylic acid reductase [Mycolicibacterium sp. CBMA 334]MUM39765.1 carboxylic acid reductase [Mycolicibacterium sp. CBMA 247]MUM44183.1 carboxylic acid reductase [Mycolicibacterium sp. CBMA 294]